MIASESLLGRVVRTENEFTWLRQGQDPGVPWLPETELLAAIEPAGEDGG